MNEIREIVTKAIVAKGKKTINLSEIIKTDVKPYSILGCWIINHEFEAKRNEPDVDISGSFEVNIWYSSKQNSKTDVLREVINYKKDIKIKQLVKEYMDTSSDDVIAKILKHPTVINAKIIEDTIEIDITFECLVEVIGETKMQVTVFKDTNDLSEDIEDLDIEIEDSFFDIDK